MRTSVLRLPARGTLLIGSDLQGNLRVFQQLHRHFEALGADAQLVLTGDLVHGPDEDTAGQWPADCYLEPSTLAVEKLLTLIGGTHVQFARGDNEGIHPFPHRFRKDSKRPKQGEQLAFANL